MSDIALPNNAKGLEQFDAQPQRLLTSIDTSTKAGRLAAYQANKGEAKNLLDFANMPLTIKAWTAHDASKVDEETGEVVEMVRLALTATTGDVFQTFSDYVRRDFLKLLYVHGTDIASDPITFVVRKSARGKRNFYTLEYVDGASKRIGREQDRNGDGDSEGDQGGEEGADAVSASPPTDGDQASAQGAKGNRRRSR